MATQKWKDENQDKLRAYRRDWYYRNRADSIAKAADRNQQIRAWFADLKSKLACASCGENHPATLDFHHADGDDKEMIVSRLVGMGNNAHVLAEIKKCIVLGSNCHRKLHYEDGTSGRSRTD